MLNIDETEKQFHMTLKQNIERLKKNQENESLRSEILEGINSSIFSQEDEEIFLRKYVVINNEPLINDIIDTRNYKLDIENDLSHLIQAGIVEMGYPHRIII